MSKKTIAWAKVYGEDEGAFEFSLAGKRFIVVCKHAFAAELLAQRPFKLRRGASTRESVPFEGLFMAEGDQWRQDKRIVGPAFSHKHINEYLASIKCVAERLVDVLASPAGGEEARTVEVRHVMYCVTADVIAFTAFGHDFDSLRRCCPVLDALKQLFPIIMLRALSPVQYWKLPLFGQRLDGCEQVVTRLTRAVDHIIEERRAADAAQSEQGREPPFTVLRKMLERSAAEPAKFEHRRVVGNLLTLFVAGADTTSIAMTWMLYHVAKDAALQRELAAEVAPLDMALLSMEELSCSLPRLRSLFYECLRMHGPADTLDFQNDFEDVTLAGRTYAPDPSRVFLVMAGYISQAAEAEQLGVGPEPDKFEARRWLQPDGSVRSPPADVVMPFGQGMRLCPGKDLAMLECLVCVGRVLQVFALALTPGHSEVGSQTHFTEQPDRDVNVVFTPRTGKKE